MGHRANLVLVDETGYRLHYCHWCANRIDEALFWGPQYAIPYIMLQPDAGSEGWLDDVWAEGGALIDTVKRVYLFFGGEALLHDIPLRRLYLQLLQEVWEGWEVRWAYEEIVALAEYVGVPASAVTSAWANDDEENAYSVEPIEDKSFTDIVGSVRFEDGSLHFFPQAGSEPWALYRGPKLIEDLRAANSLPELLLADWGADFPDSGFHIDVGQRHVQFWSATTWSGIRLRDRVNAAWAGWHIEWLQDNYERHLACTDGKVQLPAQNDDELLAHIEAIVLREHSGKSMVEGIQELASKITPEGSDVWINPRALTDNSVELSPALRRQIFDRAVAKWRAKQG